MGLPRLTRLAITSLDSDRWAGGPLACPACRTQHALHIGRSRGVPSARAALRLHIPLQLLPYFRFLTPPYT